MVKMGEAFTVCIDDSRVITLARIASSWKKVYGRYLLG